ncbi:MAG: hypothetical protein ACI4JM_00935 [Oscillospiraceae bacterium]
MEERIDIIFKTIETMAFASNIKAMRLNAAAINMLIHRLSTDDVNFGELLTYVAERLYTEINLLKNGDDGVRFFVIEIEV